MAFPVQAQRITPRQITPRDDKERTGGQGTPATKEGDPKTSVGVAAFARKDGPSDQQNSGSGSGSGNSGGSAGKGQTHTLSGVPVAAGAPATTTVAAAQATRATDQVVRSNNSAAGVPGGWQRYMPHMMGKPIRIRGPVPNDFSDQIRGEMTLARVQHRPMNRDHVASGRYDRIG